MITEIQDSAFQTEVLDTDQDVIVDFFTPGCIPCKQVDTVLMDVKKEVGASVKIVKINVCKAPESSSRFSIMSVPTVMSFKAGRITGSLTGARQCKDYISMVK